METSIDQIVAQAVACDPLRHSGVSAFPFDAEQVTRAIDALLAEGLHVYAATLAGSLSVFWQDSGDVATGRRLTERVLNCQQPGVGDIWCRAHLLAGELAFRQGDQATATVATQTALALARAARCDELIARCAAIGVLPRAT